MPTQLKTCPDDPNYWCYKMPDGSIIKIPKPTNASASTTSNATTASSTTNNSTDTAPA